MNNKEQSQKTLTEFYATKKEELNFAVKIEEFLSRASIDFNNARSVYDVAYHKGERDTLNKILVLYREAGK